VIVTQPAVALLDTDRPGLPTHSLTRRVPSPAEIHFDLKVHIVQTVTKLWISTASAVETSPKPRLGRAHIAPSNPPRK